MKANWLTRTSIVVASGLVTGLLLSVLAASAEAKPVRGTEAFEGSCEMSGTVRFDPPLGPADQRTGADAVARGTCSGTLTTSRRTRNLRNSPVAYRARTEGTQSCASSDAAGSGFLRFGKRRIRFDFSEQRAVVLAPISLEGRKGGTFDGMAIASGDPGEVLAACLENGLAEAAIEITGETANSISG